jgi:hypothetical protein
MLSLNSVRKHRLTAYSLLLGLLLTGSGSYAAQTSEAQTSPTTATPVLTVAATAPAPDASPPAGIAANDSPAAAPAGSGKEAPTLRLRAEVTEFAGGELSKSIDDLEKAATEKIRRAELLAKEKHYKSGMARLVASGKDLAELATAYRGFEQSSEAADIILNEKVKLKSGSAVSYLKQKQSDDTRQRTITALMQLATGFGTADQEQGKAAVSDGIAELADLTDRDQAEKTAEMLKSWCQSQKVLFHPPLAGPIQIQAECRDIISQAMQEDHVIKGLKASLHRYNKRSTLARTTAKVVNTTLSITSMSPTFIAPASQIAWMAFIMTQGGPEESKLLKEVYLSKQFESRFQTLNNETSLAVNSYNAALMSQNPALLAFSQYVIGQLRHPPQPETQSASPDGKLAGVSRKNRKTRHEETANNKTENKISDGANLTAPDKSLADKTEVKVQ